MHHDPPTLSEVRDRARSLGYDLVGVVGAAAFDAAQPSGRRAREAFPECGNVLVMGSGGPRFWERMVAADGEPGVPRPWRHPIHAYTRRTAGELAAWLRERGVESRIVHPGDRRPLNFVQLAEMAGLGTISPVIGLLLHPEFGPWVSLRAALLVRGAPFVPADADGQALDFAPCLSCVKPCLRACPAQVYDGLGGVALERCAAHRHAGGCDDGCDVRRACPVGTEHRYGRTEEAFRHAYSLFSMRRHFGLGPWRLVPPALRTR